MRIFKEYTIWDAVTPQTVTSSTDATPIVITKTSHGLNTGDLIMIVGHTTNIAVNGIWSVVKVNANTFKIADINTGVLQNGSGAGAGSGGIMVTAPKILFCEDFRNIVFALDTSSSANFTLKLNGSLGKTLGDTVQGNDTPNFGATQSKSNPYTNLQIVDLQGAATVDGDTGITSAGTDVHKTYEVNVNGMKYICPSIGAWSAGVFTLKAKCFSNE